MMLTCKKETILVVDYFINISDGQFEGFTNGLPFQCFTGSITFFTK